jgi:YD repeat-containing protein
MEARPIMRKPFATSLLLALLCALTPALADSKSGTITEWDGAKHLVTIKDAGGKASTFGWNQKTKVQGIAKLGEHVTVAYTNDADGKPWAAQITVTPPSPAKSSTAKSKPKPAK